MKNIATINLRTLTQNARNVKSLLNPNQRLFAVVKADAYGHGATMVANAIYQIVDGYCVALVEEGEELRRCGIDKPILCFFAPITEEDVCRALENRLILTVTDVAEIVKINEIAKRLKTVAFFHVKVDTGMNRQGVNDFGEFEKLCEKARNLSNVKCCGVYSHYAMPQNAKRKASQTKVYEKYVNIAKNYFGDFSRHISASGGFITGDNYDIVRIGILLYGYSPFTQNKVKVEPIMEVFAPIIKSSTVKKGEGLLYGKYTIDKNEKVSLVRFGYADGLPRKPIERQLNNKCMDVFATNKVTKNGQFQILFKNAEHLAKKYGTISYEILVNVAKRCERKYLN